MRESLKDRTLYVKVSEEFLEIIKSILENMGDKNNVKIGDIVAIDYEGFHKTSQEEVGKIAVEDIIDYSTGTENEYVLVRNKLPE